VGAIALVLLMVILLPIVLEDRAAPDSQEEIAILMPDGSAANVDDNQVDTEKMSPEAALEVETLALPEVMPPKAEPKPKPVKPKVVEPKEVKAKPVPKPTVKPVEKKVKEEKVVVKETAKKTTPKQESGQFYVQIGVFSNIENVKKLQVKLDELGYQSVTEKMTTDSGEKTRLRTVSFDGRNEAAIALENIKDAGLTGMVVSKK